MCNSGMAVYVWPVMSSMGTIVSSCAFYTLCTTHTNIYVHACMRVEYLCMHVHTKNNKPRWRTVLQSQCIADTLKLVLIPCLLILYKIVQ